MSAPYLFAPIEQADGLGFCPNQAIEAAYRLDGFIHKTYRNAGEVSPGKTVWVYIAADGQSTGLESSVSAEALREQILQTQSPF